jgi:hypothetical protein
MSQNTNDMNLGSTRLDNYNDDDYYCYAPEALPEAASRPAQRRKAEDLNAAVAMAYDLEVLNLELSGVLMMRTDDRYTPAIAAKQAVVKDEILARICAEKGAVEMPGASPSAGAAAAGPKISMPGLDGGSFLFAAAAPPQLPAPPPRAPFVLPSVPLRPGYVQMPVLMPAVSSGAPIASSILASQPVVNSAQVAAPEPAMALVADPLPTPAAPTQTPVPGAAQAAPRARRPAGPRRAQSRPRTAMELNLSPALTISPDAPVPRARATQALPQALARAQVRAQAAEPEFSQLEMLRQFHLEQLRYWAQRRQQQRRALEPSSARSAVISTGFQHRDALGFAPTPPPSADAGGMLFDTQGLPVPPLLQRWRPAAGGSAAAAAAVVAAASVALDPELLDARAREILKFDAEVRGRWPLPGERIVAEKKQAQALEKQNSFENDVRHR